MMIDVPLLDQDHSAGRKIIAFSIAAREPRTKWRR
jgi:hypothetical protein